MSSSKNKSFDYWVLEEKFSLGSLFDSITIIVIFNLLQLKPEDWSECECSFKLYESQLKIIKESDVCDERQHCLLFTSIGSVVKYLSVETRQELLKMESSWNTALCSAVRRLKVSSEFARFPFFFSF